MRQGALIVLALLAPVPALACALPDSDVFAWFERAVTVADVEVGAAGAVRARVVLKGAAPATVASRPPCALVAGQRRVIFLDRSGALIGVASDAAPVVAALERWRAAGQVERRRLLERHLRDASPTLRRSAEARLRWTSSRAGAEARLTALWPLLAGIPGLHRFDEAMRAGCRYSTISVPAATAAARVRDTMGKEDPSIVGTVAALAALGSEPVWNVTCSVGFYSIFAYLRARDGELVMLWVPPEG